MTRAKTPTARLSSGTAAALILLWGATAAADPIHVPTCADMEQLAAQVDAGDRVPINRWAEVSERSTGLTLVAAVASPAFVNVFGKPMLDWGREDLAVFSPALNDCMRAATKARRFDAQKQLIELRRVVQFHMSQPLNQVNRARQWVSDNLAALQALPTSTDKLVFFGLLAQLEQAESSEAGATTRQRIERMRVDGAVPARQLAASIYSLPQPEADAVFEQIAAARDELVEAVLSELKRQLDAAPGTVAGLVAVADVLTNAETSLGEFAPPERLETLTAAAGEARERVWDDLEQEIESAPASTEGLAHLSEMMQSADARRLGREDAARLSERIGARREAVADASVQAPIERLAGFPDSLSGLGEFVAYSRKTREALSRQYPTAARQAFENAYAEEHQRRVVEVQTEFESWLDAVPETREGVARINAELKALDAPARSDLYLAGLTRAQQIVTAVNREQRRARCAAALPEVELDDDDAAQPVLGLGGERPTLGDLLCDLGLAGVQVHSYEGPGLFGDEHSLALTAQDGVYRTYTLQSAQVGPDEEALVGIRVEDPVSEHPLDVQGWQKTLAGLLPDSPAAQDARCADLLSKPEAELSTNDRMAAVGCIMGSLTGH